MSSDKKKRPTAEIDPTSVPLTAQVESEMDFSINEAVVNSIFRMEKKLTRECEEARQFRAEMRSHRDALEGKIDAFIAKTNDEIGKLHEEVGTIKARISALESG